jgi:hypothetical protein
MQKELKDANEEYNMKVQELMFKSGDWQTLQREKGKLSKEREVPFAVGIGVGKGDWHRGASTSEGGPERVVDPHSRG